MNNLKSKILKFLYSFSILSENGNFNHSSITNKSLFPLLISVFISNMIYCIIFSLLIILNGLNKLSFSYTILLLLLFAYFLGYLISKNIKNDLELHRNERIIESKFIIFTIFLLSLFLVFFISYIGRLFAPPIVTK